MRARETRDNAGVQYGLKALRSGALTPEEFVKLNEIIGGFDRDSNLSVNRAQADAEALAIAYRTGIVMSGKNLAKHAEIDMRGWDDSMITLPPGVTQAGAIHYVWRSFSIRDRLDKQAGNHDSQVMWRFARNGLLPSATMANEAFLTMDQWLTSLKADTGTAPIEQKVRSAKPVTAFDYCLLSSDATQSNKVTDKAICDADPFLKPGASPRQTAGGPLTEDILKCQSKPLDPAEYAPAVLSQAQLDRLAALFPAGVCDWSKSGVGQQDAVGPLSFKAGPAGQPLGTAPVSRPQ